jgi:hypothetical protein
MSWTVLSLVTVVALAPATLAAQKLTDPMLPLPETSKRLRQLEPPPDGSGRIFEVWRVGAPPEMMLGWYLRRLNRLSPVRDGTLDTSNVIVGDTRPPMSYHVTYHTFADECMDSAATTPASNEGARACTRWRFAKEKRRSLDNNRVSIEMGEWIERVTFTWYVRELSGELVRRQIELRDTGLSDDWKRYTLVTQMTLQRDVVQPAAASP